MIQLRTDQVDAIRNIRNGNILCGGVGSGKSLTSLGYYYTLNGGVIDDGYMKTFMKNPCDLYIITTAYKRDTQDWHKELLNIYMHPESNYYDNTVVIDSWNNIEKYINIQDAFFIFDEQKVVGSGAWVKSFYKIVKKNRWILLSATPGDKWIDYVPVFVANGFFKNKTEFIQDHVVYNYHVSFPQIQKYLGEKKLERLRQQILVDIDFSRTTVPHHIDVIVPYDKMMYKEVCITRKNPFEIIQVKDKTFQKPIENSSEFCNVLRKIVNSDPNRGDIYRSIIHQNKIGELIQLAHALEKVIVFYNFDYELEILRKIDYGEGYVVGEWNGHQHDKLTDLEKNGKWIYLVQYNAGAEGWNCITTPYMIFYSENYSYRMMEQASGRIDRANTRFIDLYYWHLRSTSNIDLAIHRTLLQKKKFNAAAFSKKYFNEKGA